MESAEEAYLAALKAAPGQSEKLIFPLKTWQRKFHTAGSKNISSINRIQLVDIPCGRQFGTEIGGFYEQRNGGLSTLDQTSPCSPLFGAIQIL